MFEEGIELRRIHGADKVFDLSLGNPILEPPPEFRTELMRIAQDETLGTHRYMPNNGLPETRAAVAAELSDETGLLFNADDVMMTVGAAGALNVILRSLLDQDDEVVLFAPYFAEYVFYISHQGGQTKVAHCDEDFQPDPESLAAAITPRTRAVIINSPNNPTGVIYPAERIAELGEVIRDAENRYGTEIYLVADEPYRKLIYSDSPTRSSTRTINGRWWPRPIPRISGSPGSGSVTSQPTLRTRDEAILWTLRPSRSEHSDSSTLRPSCNES